MYGRAHIHAGTHTPTHKHALTHARAHTYTHPTQTHPVSPLPRKSRIITFTFRDGSAPHHLAVVQLTGDGLGPLGLDEAVLTDH
jgi:hypothetical protein